VTAVAAFGDTGPSLQARIAAAVAATRPDAVLFLGDAVDQHGLRRAGRFRAWARDLAPVGAKLMAVAGNHDFEPGGTPERFDAALRTLGCPPERRFRFTFADDRIHLVGISLPWRRAALAREDLDWCQERFDTADPSAIRVLALHQPLFPIAGRIGVSLDAEPAARDTLLDLLERWGVRLVLCGHEHLYARREIGPGILQVISGGGGAAREHAVFGHADVVSDRPHFVLIAATMEGVSLEARGAGGDLLDRVALAVSA
jgi:3',5'-cyclic AMP phosphodiesterase CpdA